VPPVVLVVDDTEATRYASTHALKRAGFEVREAATGAQALEMAHQGPDAIVLDINLPDLSGLQVCRTLKSDPQTGSIPILNLTAAFESSQARAEALEAGADAYLTLPVEPIVLVATLRALLRARAAEARLTELLAREQQARAEAERVNLMKDEFLATLSHELRTPLNAIVGWAQLLRQGLTDGANLRRGVEVILRNARLQEKLISDILDVSRIVAGKLRVEPRLMDLSDVVSHAVEASRPAAAKKGVTIEWAPSDHAVPLLGDPIRLQQVIGNLLSNAVKFTATGGRAGVRLEELGAAVRVTVEDDGPGIDPDFLPHVFERFRQGDASSTRRHGGLGLGLAIVRHMVELHGGSVHATNREPGPGAVLEVTLPRPPAMAEGLPDLGTTRSPARADVRDALSGATVLVVDDDTDARSLAAFVLERCGARVLIARSAAEALALLRHHQPDVLLADIEMPHKDGLQLMREVRALPAAEGGDTPAAAVTAYASAQDRARALDAGFQVHLVKPIDPDALAAAVARLARTRTPRSPAAGV
jgi:signal transduction histidine kinase